MSMMDSVALKGMHNNNIITHLDTEHFVKIGSGNNITDRLDSEIVL